MSRVVLDAGAFLALERGDARLRAHLAAVVRLGLELATTSPVVAQVWRGGGRQALVARLFAATWIDAPDEDAARRAGELLAQTGTKDVVDAFLVGLVRNGDSVISSDPDDISRLLSARSVKGRIIQT